MWMGELITNRGIGNGMSLIIFCSVVSGLPSAFSAVYAAENGAVKLAIFLAFFVVMLLFIVFIELGQRRIPVQFAKRVVGRRMYAGQSTYIPLKVNQAGVVPIIFASAVINLPVLLSQVLPSDGWGASVSKWINDNLANTVNPFYLAVLGPAHRRVRVLLHGHRLRPGPAGGQPAQAGRLHPGHPSRSADRDLPGQGPQPHHPARRHLHRHPGHQPDHPGPVPARRRRQRCRLLHRRHVAADRRGRGAGDHEAGRQPADDAQLRRLPVHQVRPRRPRAGAGWLCRRTCASREVVA